MPASSGLPINQALEPDWVRHGSASVQKAYETALSFEQTLVEQLSKALTATSGLGGEPGQEGQSSSEEGGEFGGSSEISSMLPQALSSGLMSAGGLGLAAQLTRQLADTPSSAAITQTAATQPAATQTAAAPTDATQPVANAGGTLAAGAPGAIDATGGTGS